MEAEVPESAVLLAQGILLNESTSEQDLVNVVFMFYKNNGLLRTSDENIIAEQVSNSNFSSIVCLQLSGMPSESFIIDKPLFKDLA